MKEYKGLKIYSTTENRLGVARYNEQKRSVHITDEIWDIVCREAVYAECTTSEFVRAIIRKWIDENGIPEADKPEAGDSDEYKFVSKSVSRTKSINGFINLNGTLEPYLNAKLKLISIREKTTVKDTLRLAIYSFLKAVRDGEKDVDMFCERFQTKRARGSVKAVCVRVELPVPQDVRDEVVQLAKDRGTFINDILRESALWLIYRYESKEKSEN